MKMIDNYRDLPIGKYLEICDIAKDESLDVLNEQVKVISILTDMSEDDILGLPITDYKDMSRRLVFLRKEYDGELPVAKSYKIGGFELIPEKDLTKITTAQFIDFQTFSREGDKYYVEALSTLMIPKGKKYNEGYDITEVHKAIRENLSVADVLSLSAFFLGKWVRSIKDSLTFSMSEIKKIPDKEKREELMRMLLQRKTHSQSNGDGSPM